MLAAGSFLRYKNFVDEKSTHALAKLFINFFYPCLIFSFLVGNFNIEIIQKDFVLPIGLFFIMVVGYIVGFIFTKFVAFDTIKQRNMFNFQCLLNNYSFLPFPIILMFFGETMASKHLFSTLGAEIAVWTIGIFCLTGEKFDAKFLKKLVSIPIITILFSFLFIIIRDLFIKMPVPVFLREINSSLFFVIDMFGMATVPIAMIVAGSRIFGLGSKLQGFFADIKQWYILFLRLIVIPFIVFLIIKFLPFEIEDYILKIWLIVAVMPVAVSSIVFSENFNSDTTFATKSVLITHVFSLITIPIWFKIFLF